MSERRTLRWLRHLLLEYALDDEWRSTTALHAVVSSAGEEWYRVALVLERLAADGHAELQVRGPVRRFRRARRPRIRVHPQPRFDTDHNDAAGEAAGRSTP